MKAVFFIIILAFGFSVGTGLDKLVQYIKERTR